MNCLVKIFEASSGGGRFETSLCMGLDGVFDSAAGHEAFLLICSDIKFIPHVITVREKLDNTN